MKTIRRNLIVAILAFCFVQTQAQTNENLFFVFLNTNPNKVKLSTEQVDSLQTAHLNNIGKLADEGILLAAGPFETGGGIFIIHANSSEQAQEILSTDPAIAANRYKIEIFPFYVMINELCEPRQPYEMVTYQFIRLKANPADSGEAAVPYRKNRTFLDELNNQNDFVVINGNFDFTNMNGILILDVKTKEEAEEIMKENPAVIENRITYEIKPLWIAKGTFCKN